MKKGEIRSHEEYVKLLKEKYGNKYTPLTQYTGSENPIKIRYNECGHEYTVKAKNAMNGKNCPVCYGGVKLTQEEVEKRVNEMFNGEYIVAGKYKNYKSPIDIKHIRCGSIFPVNAGGLLNNKTCHCPKCFPTINNWCIPYINDIYSTNQYLYSLLKDKEDGHRYKENSHKKTWFVCPYCGKDIEAIISNVKYQGLSCPNCGGGISFAEKLMSNVLSDLHIKYKFQFSPNWIKPYRYDFMLKKNGIKYIIEMDGGWHYTDNKLSGLTAEEAKIRDEIKNQKALENNYVIIRINCDYKGNDRFDYIKTNIINSELNKILDLSKVNWDNCEKISDISTIKIIANEWDSGLKSVQQLIDKLSLSDNIIRKYLYKASDIGLIPESINDIKKLNIEYRNKIYGEPRAKKVKCDQTGEIFSSFREANKKYNADVGRYFKRKIENGTETSGYLPNGTRLTWTKI